MNQTHRTRNVGSAVSFAVCLMPLAVPTAAANDLARQVERVLQPLPQPQSTCGASVIDLSSGDLAYRAGGDDVMMPASNAKLFVLAAAVDLLGPDFRFRTTLARRGDDLIVIGDGDPSIGDERVAGWKDEKQTALFDQWAEALRAAGLTNVRGSLLLDESIFDTETTHVTWEASDLRKWYGAPVGALNFNDNCLDFTVWPSDDRSRVFWQSFPESDLISVDLRCKVGAQGTPVINRPAADLHFVISGTCSRRGALQAVPAPDPAELFGSALRTALRQRGITITGKTRREKVATGGPTQLPGDCTVLAVYETPLNLVLLRAGRQSQNLFADCLFKRIGAEWARAKGIPDARGTWETGRAAVKAYLARVGVAESAVEIVDGSGLSRENRASAESFARVLAHMHGHPHRNLFISALASPGEDGTLRRRMANLDGQVFVKTGYLRGVRTMSGYAVTPSGQWRAFSVLFNNIRGGAAPFNKVHDELCRVLVADE